MKAKQQYIAPSSNLVTVALKERMMLTLSVHSEETEIIGSNQNSTFEEEEITGGAHDFQLWEE